MMVTSCSAYGCTNRCIQGSKVRFHRFPLHKPDLLKKWIIAMRRKSFEPTKYSSLCSNHFTIEDYKTSCKHRLKADAVPSLFKFTEHLQKSVEKSLTIKKVPLEVDSFSKEEMFHIVSFDSDVVKEKMVVVPSMWLNKNNTLCILPPAITNAKLEILAEVRAQPAEGWGMYGVSCLKKFDTYAQAKEDLETMKRTATLEPSESDGIQNRKRRRPSHLNQYDTSDDDDDDDDDDELELLEDESSPMAENPTCSSSSKEITIVNRPDTLIDSRPMAEVSPCSSSSREITINRRDPEINESRPMADPVIVKVEPLSQSSGNNGPTTEYPTIRLSDLATLLRTENAEHNDNQSTTSTRAEDSQLQISSSFLSDACNTDITCPCNSACHKLILQALVKIQKDLDKNARLLQQLLNQDSQELPRRPPFVPTTSYHLPTNFPITLPAKDIKDVEELEAYLQENSNFTRSIPYFTSMGGRDAKHTHRRIMEKIIGDDLAKQLNWKGRGTKKPFSAYVRIHSLVFNAVKANPKSQVVTLSDIEKFIKDWLRFAPDRNGNRQKRRRVAEEKVLMF